MFFDSILTFCLCHLHFSSSWYLHLLLWKILVNWIRAKVDPPLSYAIPVSLYACSRTIWTRIFFQLVSFKLDNIQKVGVISEYFMRDNTSTRLQGIASICIIHYLMQLFNLYMNYTVISSILQVAHFNFTNHYVPALV